mgnify:CR=1 FL=1
MKKITSIQQCPPHITDAKLVIYFAVSSSQVDYKNLLPIPIIITGGLSIISGVLAKEDDSKDADILIIAGIIACLIGITIKFYQQLTLQRAIPVD